MEPSRVQCAWGKTGEKPGMVMFCSKRLNSGSPYQPVPSAVNYSPSDSRQGLADREWRYAHTMLTMKTFGANLVWALTVRELTVTADGVRANCETFASNENRLKVHAMMLRVC